MVHATLDAIADGLHFEIAKWPNDREPQRARRRPEPATENRRHPALRDRQVAK